jgi:hypothetical protein
MLSHRSELSAVITPINEDKAHYCGLGFYVIIDFEVSNEAIIPDDVTYTAQEERAFECFNDDFEEVAAVLVLHAPEGPQGCLYPVATAGPVPQAWQNCTFDMIEALMLVRAQRFE